MATNSIREQILLAVLDAIRPAAVSLGATLHRSPALAISREQCPALVDARLNLNKGALDIDFLASTGLVNAFDQSNKEIQKMYVNKLEQNSLDQDFLQNILDQINEQLAAKADALARTKGGLLPDYVKSSGVVVAIDEPSVELCRNDGSNIQCIQTPTNQNSTITQIQGSVEITNRVNQGGSTTITIRQSN